MSEYGGRVAIITGGASRIGKATAIHLANKEAKVTIADIGEEEGKKMNTLHTSFLINIYFSAYFFGVPVIFQDDFVCLGLV